MSYAKVTIISASILFGAATAHADDDTSPLTKLAMPAPNAGVATAKETAPTWCGVVKAKAWTPNAIVRTFDSRYFGSSAYGEAAQMLCQWPQDPAVAHAVGVLAQKYMNNAGVSQARAMELLALRGQPETLAAAKVELCKSLSVSDEVSGEDKWFAHARQSVFGCPNGDPQWTDSKGDIEKLRPFLDSSAQEPDLVVRTSFALDRTALVFKSGGRFDEEFLNYITDQFDLKDISDDDALKVLDQAPYKDNPYARVILLESVANARLGASLLQQEIEQRTKDDGWKQLLVTAPRAAAEAFEKATTPWKEQLARSAAFERKFWGPSKKAAQGCWATLEKDFVDVMKTMKHANENEIEESLNEPVPALLWQRLAACASVDKDPGIASEIEYRASNLRYIRGPRAAAYFAGMAALKEIVEDRRNFPIELWKMTQKQPKNDLLEAAGRRHVNASSKFGPFYFGSGSKENGTVKSVKAGENGVVITFVTTKTQIMMNKCESTNKLLRFDSRGNAVYYQKCHDTGLETVTTNPEPIVVPTELAGGIKPGMVMYVHVAHPQQRYAFPVAVYADKKKSKLVNYYGIAF